MTKEALPSPLPGLGFLLPCLLCSFFEFSWYLRSPTRHQAGTRGETQMHRWYRANQRPQARTLASLGRSSVTEISG